MTNIQNDGSDKKLYALSQQLQNDAESAVNGSAKALKLFEQVAQNSDSAEEFLENNIDTSELSDDAVKALLDKLLDFLKDLVANKKEESEPAVEDSAVSSDVPQQTASTSEFLAQMYANPSEFTNVILAVTSGDASSISSLGKQNVLTAISVIGQGVTKETSMRLKYNQEAIGQFTEQLNNTIQTYNDNLSKIANFQSQIDGRTAQLSSLESQITTLRSASALKEEEIAKVQEQIDKIQVQIDEKQAAVDEKQAAYDSKQAEINTKEAEISTKEGEISAKEAEISTKNDDISNKKTEIKEQKTKIKSCQKAYNAATKSVKSLSSQLSKLQKNNKDGKNDSAISSVQSQLQAAKTEQERCKQELQEAKETLKAQQAELKQMQKDLKQLKKELKALKKELKTLNKELKKLKKEFAKIEKEKTGLEGELEKLKTQQEPYNNQKAELESQKEGIESQITTLQQTAQEAERDIENMQEEKAQLEAENVGLQEEIKTLRFELDAYYEEQTELVKIAKEEIRSYYDGVNSDSNDGSKNSADDKNVTTVSSINDIPDTKYAPTAYYRDRNMSGADSPLKLALAGASKADVSMEGNLIRIKQADDSYKYYSITTGTQVSVTANAKHASSLNDWTEMDVSALSGSDKSSAGIFEKLLIDRIDDGNGNYTVVDYETGETHKYHINTADDIDKNEDNKPSFSEVVNNLKSRGLPDDKLPKSLDEIDKDGDGIVSEEELNQFILSKFTNNENSTNGNSDKPLNFVS